MPSHPHSCALLFGTTDARRARVAQLGYVGGSYTKRSAADRHKFESDSAAGQPSTKNSYTLPEELMAVSVRRSLAQP